MKRGNHACRYSKLRSLTRINRIVYDMLIDDNEGAITKYANRLISQGINIDYKRYFSCFIRIKFATTVSKYRDFQYRLNLGKLVFNSDLYQWKKSDSEMCSFCEKESETIVHCLVKCEKVAPIIAFLYELCEICEINYTNEVADFLFNTFIDDNCIY